MRYTTTIIIGAGQSGLAMSHQLMARSIDHVLFERGDIANTWRTERWDSLRLLTPNWQTRLPGAAYSGEAPDSFMNLAETIQLLDSYADGFGPPVQTQTTVRSVEPTDAGYIVRTNREKWCCRTLVLANGAMGRANIPAIASALPQAVRSLHVRDYRSPDSINEGGVLIVGASASGVQIAQELQQSGRQVLLSTGEHVRLPRQYRGRDILWLMDQSGILDDRIEDVDDVVRVRNLPSMQLQGSEDFASIGLNSLQSIGVEVVGRLVGFRDTVAQFSGSLGNVCQLADLKMGRLLRTLDTWIDGMDVSAFGPPEHFAPTYLPKAPVLTADFTDRDIRTVIWATGFQPDYSWLNLPVLDHKGRLRHVGGVVEAPGVYAMGLPFMRKRKSNFIDGVGDDAAALSAHLAGYLAGQPSLVA